MTATDRTDTDRLAEAIRSAKVFRKDAGDLADAIALSLAPVVSQIAARRAAEELRKMATVTANSDDRWRLRDRAAEMDAAAALVARPPRPGAAAMSVGTCPCDTTGLHPPSECTRPGATAVDVAQDDVRALLDALGLGAHARPYSPHAVIHREILPAFRILRDDRKRLENFAIAMINAPEDDAVADWGYELARLLDGGAE